MKAGRSARETAASRCHEMNMQRYMTKVECHSDEDENHQS